MESRADTAAAFDEPFEDSDDFLHDHDSHPWWVETWWFSFFAPERALGGWLFGMARPNQGASTGGAWIWDRSGCEARSARFFAHYTALPTRMEALRSNPVRFPSRYQIEVLEPCRDYRLTFDDETAGLDIDLRFAATMPALGHKAQAAPFYQSADYDQAGRVNGRILLEGESIEIDCFAMRDRSWGLRSERVVPDFSYCWRADRDEAFLVYSPRLEGPLVVNRGILHRGGISRPIVQGTREEVRDPVNGWITEVSVSAVDDTGRSVDARARAVSRLVHPRPTSSNTISILEWTTPAGERSWGEDQDVWPHESWKRWMSRTGSGLGA